MIPNKITDEYIEALFEPSSEEFEEYRNFIVRQVKNLWNSFETTMQEARNFHTATCSSNFDGCFEDFMTQSMMEILEGYRKVMFANTQIMARDEQLKRRVN